MTMTIERWSPVRHAGLIGAWYKRRGMAEDAGELSTYPRTGFVVGGLLAGFVYSTDSSVAVADQWVASPDATASERAMAMELLLLELERAARDELGAQFLTLCTPLKTVTSLALSRGYLVDERPHHFAMRSL